MVSKWKILMFLFIVKMHGVFASTELLKENRRIGWLKTLDGTTIQYYEPKKDSNRYCKEVDFIQGILEKIPEQIVSLEETSMVTEEIEQNIETIKSVYTGLVRRYENQYSLSKDTNITLKEDIKWCSIIFCGKDIGEYVSEGTFKYDYSRLNTIHVIPQKRRPIIQKNNNKGEISLRYFFVASLIGIVLGIIFYKAFNKA